MRACLLIAVIALCAGCAHTSTPFVQGSIRIVPPIARDGSDKTGQLLTETAFNDGGTKLVQITDADGKKFHVYIDHRIDSSTPRAIYLIDYPGRPNSVLVTNQQSFKQTIGEFE